MKVKIVKNQKSTGKKSFVIIGCMSHPEKATLLGYLGNYRFLRLDHEDKKCLERKLEKKLILITGCMSHPEKATSSC